MNTNKIDLIKAEVERMHNLLPVMDGDNISVNYADRICTTLEMYIDSLQEEPVSEDKDLEETINTIKLLTSNTALLTFEYGFRKGAEWQMNKLPKWRRTPIQGGCWSGEIGVRPTARLFIYEHYSINADKLFKLLKKEGKNYE